MKTLCVCARPDRSVRSHFGGKVKMKNLFAVAARFVVLSLLWGTGAAVQAADLPYTVKPGDLLSISIWKEPDLQGDVLVTPDGTFAFPLVGQVDARNKTVTDLHKLITERLKGYISDPVVTVSVKEIKGNKVYVIGQVTRPGEFIVNPSVDVMQALSMAGGTTPFASLANIMILRRAAGNQQSFRFDYTNVVKGRSLEQNIELQSGDVVVVP